MNYFFLHENCIQILLTNHKVRDNTHFCLLFLVSITCITKPACGQRRTLFMLFIEDVPLINGLSRDFRQLGLTHRQKTGKFYIRKYWKKQLVPTKNTYCLSLRVDLRITFYENVSKKVFRYWLGIKQARNPLIHWGRVTHICINKQVPWLVQIMVCRLFSDNPLSEPMMVYCQLDSKEQISMKFLLNFNGFHSRKYIWKCCLQKWQPSCLSLNVCWTNDNCMLWS